jgi:hypothetical protein
VVFEQLENRDSCLGKENLGLTSPYSTALNILFDVIIPFAAFRCFVDPNTVYQLSGMWDAVDALY